MRKSISCKPPVLVKAMLGSRLSFCSLQSKGSGARAGFGVRGMCQLTLSKEHPLLEQHNCSGSLFYCQRSSCPPPFAPLRRCWGARPAGLCAGRRETRLWREATGANVPLSAPVPCRLAFDSPVFPPPSSQDCSQARCSLLSLTAREERSGRCRDRCGKSRFSPVWKTELDQGVTAQISVLYHAERNRRPAQKCVRAVGTCCSSAPGEFLSGLEGIDPYDSQCLMLNGGCGAIFRSLGCGKSCFPTHRPGGFASTG